jgi:hypothetical protein
MCESGGGPLSMQNPDSNERISQPNGLVSAKWREFCHLCAFGEQR